MRTPVITRFAKNVRPSSVRRGLAAIATTAVLASGAQILTAGNAWACGAPDDAPVVAPAQPAAPEKDDRSVELHGQGATGAFVSVPASITAGGPKVEFDVDFTNGTGADYHRFPLGISFFNKNGATPQPSQVTAEVMDHGQWKRVTLHHHCDPAIGGSAPGATAPLAKGQVGHYRFRVAVAADVPTDVNGLQVIVSPDLGVVGRGAITEVKVTHPKPTTPAKPKPTTKPAEAPAEPATDKTTAPTATPSTAPATTAPAGTPELAHTGADENSTFLALSSAALLALGAGVLIAVRRLRPQR